MALAAETGTLRRGGRIMTPAAMRAALGLKPGDTPVARVAGSSLRLTTRAAEVARVQAMLRLYPRPGVDAVDAFIALRRSVRGAT